MCRDVGIQMKDCNEDPDLKEWHTHGMVYETTILVCLKTQFGEVSSAEDKNVIAFPRREADSQPISQSVWQTVN